MEGGALYVLFHSHTFRIIKEIQLMCIDLLNHKQKQAFDRELVWSWGNLEEHLQT